MYQRGNTEEICHFDKAVIFPASAKAKWQMAKIIGTPVFFF